MEKIEDVKDTGCCVALIGCFGSMLIFLLLLGLGLKSIAAIVKFVTCEG